MTFMLILLLHTASQRYSSKKSGGVKEISSKAELKKITKKNRDKLIVVDFFLTYCPPCQRIAPVYESLAAENPNVVFLKVNGQQGGELARSYGVRGYPTFVFLKGSRTLDTKPGANEWTLRQAIKDYAGSD
ncbi:thioredoxin [Opisthorchis viverrini]|uniref:Thioredoxin n=1 Tax=Opisthorchis viverrini TaxID=6198 RepID=A0A1S8X8Z1_OPIVI|nr:thioredoxin [Opisthorchis viverrini]